MILKKNSVKMTFWMVFGFVLFSLFIIVKEVSHSSTEDSTQPQVVEKTYEKPEVFIDPVEESVTIEEKKAIFKNDA